MTGQPGQLLFPSLSLAVCFKSHANRPRPLQRSSQDGLTASCLLPPASCLVYSSSCKMFHWASRCLPGFSVIALALLLVCTSNALSLTPWNGLWPDPPAPGGASPALSIAQKVFMVYTVFVHTNMLAFAARLSCSLWYATKATRQVLGRRRIAQSSRGSTRSPDNLVDIPSSPSQKLPDPSVFKFKDPVVTEVEDDAEVVHAIILPNYGEDIHTLATTLNVLASHPRARTQYEIYLAMEQKETDAAEKAGKLMSTFEKSFLHVRSTFHPPGLQGEIAGKSSNVAFAARHIVQVHRNELSTGSCNAIVTVMDADTHLWQDYFTEIRRLHCTHLTDEADRTLYSCPIIFDRNSHQSPILVRCADLLWGFAGLSTMYPGTSLSIPTSVYSLPLSLAEKVGGWDSDPTAIGEDMHMMLKCYFETAGNLVTRVVYVPASQCNVSGDLSSTSTTSTNSLKVPWHRRTLSTCTARYRQALRHMWGALDSGFATRRTLSYLRLHTRCLFLRPRHLALLHLLWEAHCLPVHLMILMVFSALYDACTPAAALHPALHAVFWATGLIRTTSFIWMNLCLALYERWHALCLRTRRGDMLQANVRDTGFAERTWYQWPFLLERVCFPIAGTVFGAVPMLHAVFAHFWTDRLVYRVSKKPDFLTAVV